MHVYDKRMSARSAAAQSVLRSGADPYDVLAAVVWPSKEAIEREEQLMAIEHPDGCICIACKPPVATKPYTLTQEEYLAMKRRLESLQRKLTRVAPEGNYALPVHSEDDPRVEVYLTILKACAHAFDVFDKRGYPDDWSRWQNAADDASWQLGRFYPREEAVA